ncbi:MAG TPA: hypothetical protein VKX46_01555 [Ktedonobacteraceae bacterium]|nr:hypothetical protein [Ktedonobacteraceae bacterium]
MATSNFTKMMAVIFLFIVMVAAVIVEAWSALAQIALPTQLSTAIWGLLYSGIGLAGSIISMHVGSTTAINAVQQTPQVAAGIATVAVGPLAPPSPVDPDKTQTALPAVKRSA